MSKLHPSHRLLPLVLLFAACAGNPPPPDWRSDVPDWPLWGLDRSLFEGDIVGEGPVARGFSGGRLWPLGDIPWRLHPLSPAHPVVVSEAIRMWEEATDLRFFEIPEGTSPFPPNWIDFKNGSSCSSQIGMASPGGHNAQIITLKTNACREPQAAHEIGHALGLRHEHTRQDRDDWLVVLEDNICPPVAKLNFTKNNGRLFGPLDFASIMIYGSKTYSCDGSFTMTRLDGSSWTWQQRISTGDAAAVAELYAEEFARRDDCPECPEPPCPEPPLPDPYVITLHDRFEVRCWWTNPSTDIEARCRVGASSGESGLWWFYRESLWELYISVLDFRTLNQHWGVYLAGPTDLMYRIEVTDTETGTVKTYPKTTREPAPAITDSTAFPG